ncbi:MAG TPA: kelch repeat-containing protein [Gemmatimonadaceae bacterium]|nr:kelch repeat-containing protein [Gemmatimonadaceae bacterium]
MMPHRLSFAFASIFIGVVASPNPPVVSHVEGSIRLVGRMRVARVEVFDASMNRVVTTGEMDESRIGHSATRLSDGRVLVLGGYNGGRSGHTATLLNDRTVLIAGGVGDGWSFLSSAEVYDPRTGRFTPVNSMSVARESQTATLLSDGRVLIAGGHRDRRENIVVYASTEIYDPAQGRFRAGPMLTTARHKHEATALGDGRVLVVGGSDPRDHVHFTSAELYDPATNQWTGVSRMRAGRYKLRDTGIRLHDGRILVAGSGRFAEVFDPRTNAFTPVNGDFGQAYSFASAVLLDDGSALILGGYDDSMRNSDGIWRFGE